MFLCYFNTSAQLLFLIFQFWYKTWSLNFLWLCAILSFFSYSINPSFHPFILFLNLSFHPLLLISTTKPPTSFIPSFSIHLSFHPFLFPFFHKPNHPSIHPPSLLLSLFLSFLLLIIIFPLFIFCSFLPSFHNPNHYESFHSFIHPSFLPSSIHPFILPSFNKPNHLSFLLHHPSIHPSLSFFPLPIFLSFFPSFISQTKPPTSIHTSSFLSSFIYPSIHFFLPSIHPSIFSPTHPSFLPKIHLSSLPFCVYISQNFSFLPPIPSFFPLSRFLSFHPSFHKPIHSHLPILSSIHPSFLPSTNPNSHPPFLHLYWFPSSNHPSIPSLFPLSIFLSSLPSFYNPNTHINSYFTFTLLYPSVHPFSSTKPSSLIPSSFPFFQVYIYLFPSFIPSFFSS